MGEPRGPAKPFHASLYARVLVAIALGVAVGGVWPETGAKLAPLGEGFIKLIKLTIGPLIFCTIVVSIAGMKSMKSVGKVGGLALLYFEIATTLALVIGLFRHRESLNPEAFTSLKW